MKNIKYFILALFLWCTMSACEDSILNIENPNSPTDATFFSTEAQLEVALTGVYEIVIHERTTTFPQALDNATDIGFLRSGVGGLNGTARGDISSTDGAISGVYDRMYTGIQRANNLLQNMDRAEEEADPDRFAQIRAEALFLRAYFYHFLLEFYGDVPFRTEVATSLDGLAQARTPKATIVDNILGDLQTAAGILPETWGNSDVGRATAGAANALRARIALYNGRYADAEAAALAVMNSNTYQLFSDYEALFTEAGTRSSEVILDMPFAENFNENNLPQYQGSRFGGWAVVVPSQQMVDSYECTDGLPIDESAVYDPANPYENRDPRLDASIVRPGLVWTNVRFETHADSTKTDQVEDGEVTRRVNNRNATNNKSGPNRFTTFTGYLWKKFSNEPVLIANTAARSSLHIILMRYAEVLLTYAEAKIEAGTIDQSVLDAINDVRARAYGTDRADVGNYPAITTMDQGQLRRIIRRERMVELANEGFRLFDIRRWRIAEKVMGATLYGSPANGWSEIGGNLGFIPAIDEDGFIDYSGAPSAPRAEIGNLMYREVEERIFDASRHYLWPIPQAEIDASDGLVEQNPNY